MLDRQVVLVIQGMSLLVLNNSVNAVELFIKYDINNFNVWKLCYWQNFLSITFDLYISV